MNTKGIAKIFALAVLMPMLIVAFAIAPAQAKNPDERLVENIKVDSYKINVDDLVTDEQKMMLAELVPSDFLSYLEQIQYIMIDGTAHVNMVMSEKNDVVSIKLHVNWHGAISLLNVDEEPLVVLDSKNMQLVAHLEIPASGDIQQADLWLNFHTNSELVVYGESGSMEVDLRIHVILTFSEGQFDLIKVQLPQLGDAQLF